MPPARFTRRTALALAIAGIGLAGLPLASTAALAQDQRWARRDDPLTGYRIEVPVGLLPPLPRAPDDPQSMQAFGSADGAVLLEVYAGENTDGRSLSGFIDMLAGADRIAEVTYRRNGRSWFVLSGYYRRDDYDDEPLIFYAKFMFSPGLTHFSAFEISYPVSRRRDYDRVVERLEASLRPPRQLLRSG